MKSHTRHILATVAVLGVLVAGAAAAFVWSGVYNIGADNPHWSATHAMIETLRERSIQSRLDGIRAPNLEDPKRIELGAMNYSAMCTGCHLSPGVDDTEIRPGLYPMPPDLTKEDLGDPRRTFWVIKHGIKLTAMPAWGKTHTDEQIWDMVAFLHKQPGMTPAQYAALGGKPPAEDDDHMHADSDHSHGNMEETRTGAAAHGDMHAADAQTHQDAEPAELTDKANPVEAGSNAGGHHGHGDHDDGKDDHGH